MTGTRPSLTDRLSSTVWGVIGGLLAGLASNFVVLNWQAIKTSTVVVDKLEKRQGLGSLKWDVQLRPERRFIFSPVRRSGALLHAETDTDVRGTVASLDWQKFTSMRFFAKSSVEGLQLDEANIFVGQDHLQQYVFDAPQALSTAWHEFDLPFERFRLAPWVGGKDRKLSGKLSNVTAVGFDLKNGARDIQGSVWIDFIRLVRPDGTVVLFSDADADKFEFAGQKLNWFAAARDY